MAWVSRKATKAPKKTKNRGKNEIKREKHRKRGNIHGITGQKGR